MANVKANKKNKAKDTILKVPFLRRGVAYAIDWYLSSVLTSLPLIVIYTNFLGHSDYVVSIGNNDAQNLFEFAFPYNYIGGILGILFALLYIVIIPLWAWRGQTLGKKLMRFKIVSDSGTDVSTSALCIRQIIGILLIEGSIITASSLLHQMLSIATGFDIVQIYSFVGLVITAISIVVMFIIPKQKMLHDFLAKTQVTMIKKIG